MNKYEAMYIVTPEMEDEAIKGVIEKFSGIITANGGEIEKTDEWGRKKLAYPIDYKTEGYYVLVCGKYLSKGRKVSVIGEIQNRSYDAKDGSKRYITEIIADEIEFLTPKGQEGGSGSGGYERSGFERQNTPAPEGFSEIEDDELPF